MHERIERAFSLAGRVVVITGAASGIGREAAVLMAQAGAHVVLGDINAQGLSETVRDIGNAATCQRTDVRERASVDALAAHALTVHGRIDVWANVAGALLASDTVDATEAQVDHLIAVNQKGVYWGGAPAARVMRQQRSGSIINLSSGAADAAIAGLSVYAMTKAAVMMMTRVLAQEMGTFGVRANAIAPGFIDTPMVSYRFLTPSGTIDHAKKEELFAQRRQGAALRMIGQASDVAFAMLYLASDASRFVTGQILRPNGGTSMP